MKKKTLVSSLIMATAVGMSANASAAATVPPPGSLNDTWFETQIKQTLPKVIDKKDSENPSSWVTVKNFKVDTGKKTCYTHLIDNNPAAPAPATPDYLVEVYCLVGGAWTHQSTADRVFDMADGNVGQEEFFLEMPAVGSDLTKPEFHAVSFVGTLILQPKIASKGGLSSVKTLTAKQGLTDYHENVTLLGAEQIEGQDHTNLKFAWVKDPTKISNVNDLQACAISWEQNTNRKLGCIDPNKPAPAPN
ncbi:hypothetical protein [Methylomicrobium lacus]|uniref:hypothetical protein n=1 Tax=Methylomicrobium lacus TaxID=136992 RepID=UPI0035A84A15